MHSDQTAIGPDVSVSLQLRELQSKLQEMAMHVFDSTALQGGLAKAASNSVRDDLAAAFLNLDLLASNQPERLEDSMQDPEELQALGFSARQSYIVARATHDLFAHGVVGVSSNLVASAINKDIAKVEKTIFDSLPVLTDVNTKLTVAPAVSVAGPASEPVAPAPAPVVAQPEVVVAEPVQNPRSAALLESLSELKQGLRATFIAAHKAGQKVDAVYKPMKQAFANLGAAEDLTASIQDAGKLQQMGFSVAQASALALSARRFLDGHESGFKDSRMQAALKLDLTRLNAKPVQKAEPAPVEPVQAVAPVQVEPVQAEAAPVPAAKQNRRSAYVVLGLLEAARTVLTDGSAAALEIGAEVKKSCASLLKRARTDGSYGYKGLAATLCSSAELQETGFSKRLAGSIVQTAKKYLGKTTEALSTVAFTAALRAELVTRKQAHIDAAEQEIYIKEYKRLNGLDWSDYKSGYGNSDDGVPPAERGFMVSMRKLASARTVVGLTGSLAAVGTALAMALVPSSVHNSTLTNAGQATAAPVAAAQVVPVVASVVAAPKPKTAVSVLVGTVGTPVAASSAQPVVPAPVKLDLAAKASAPAATASQPAAPVVAVAPKAAASAAAVTAAAKDVKAKASLPKVAAAKVATAPAAKPLKVAKARFAKAKSVSVAADTAAPASAKAKSSTPSQKIYLTKGDIAIFQTFFMEQGEAYKRLQSDGATGELSQQFRNTVAYFQFSNNLEKTGELNAETFERMVAIKTASKAKAPAVG